MSDKRTVTISEERFLELVQREGRAPGNEHGAWKLPSGLITIPPDEYNAMKADAELARLVRQIPENGSLKRLSDGDTERWQYDNMVSVYRNPTELLRWAFEHSATMSESSEVEPKKCPKCGQPTLPKGQTRKDPSDYRHANGCPLDDWHEAQPADTTTEADR